MVGKLLGSGPLCDAECNNLSCCTSTQRAVDPRWPCPERVRQISDAGDDSSFEFDVGETIHLQTGARLSVLKFRVADAFLSTDRGFYMYWIDEALQTLNWAVLPAGAYTGARLAAWISSNYGSATYVEQTNEIGLAYDGNRRILNDAEIRSLFPGSGSYSAGATPSRPLSINHLLGPSFIEGAPALLHARHRRRHQGPPASGYRRENDYRQRHREHHADENGRGPLCQAPRAHYPAHPAL